MVPDLNIWSSSQTFRTVLVHTYSLQGAHLLSQHVTHFRAPLDVGIGLVYRELGDKFVALATWGDVGITKTGRTSGRRSLGKKMFRWFRLCVETYASSANCKWFWRPFGYILKEFGGTVLVFCSPLCFSRLNISSRYLSQPVATSLYVGSFLLPQLSR